MLPFILLWSALVCYFNLGIELSLEEGGIIIQRNSLNWLEWLKSLTILGLTAHLINEVYQKYELTKLKNSYPGVFYILIVGLIPGAVAIEKIAWIALALIVAIYFLFRTYRKVHSTTMIFNIGLLVGIILFIDIAYWPFILYFIYGIILINYFKINEWILYFISIALPFFYYYVYLSFQSPYQDFSSILGFPQYRWDLRFVIDQYPALALIALLGFIYLIKQPDIMRTLKIGAKKYFSLIHYLFILGVLLYLVMDYPAEYGLKILAIPLSIMMATRCSTTKNKSFALVLFYFLILTVILFQLYY